MWYYFFTIILTVVAACVDIVGKDKDKDWNIWIFILGMIAGVVFLLGIFSYEPTAMDVYKGKTELKITYKGDVPVDSVVVFKDNEK
jgi:hypothetical protein